MTTLARISVALSACLVLLTPLWAQRPSPEVLKALGIVHPKGMTATQASLAVARRVQSFAGTRDGLLPPSVPTFPYNPGFARNMNANAPLSAAVVMGRGGPLNDVVTFGDWDGAEDLVADHGGKVDDFLGKIPSQGFAITRTAVSEHTMANGFNEDIFYYGDSLGNVYVSATTNLQVDPITPNVLVINLPTVLNAFGTLNSDDQIVITGLCVNPVADLTSFSNVNGDFAGFAGQVGEVLYVTFWDTAGGLRTLANGTPISSGLLAFPIADLTSTAPTPPGVLSPSGFPVTVGGAFGVAFSTFANIAGCACDDLGAVYFQQLDLIGFTGANIVKVRPAGTDHDRSLATSGFVTIATLSPTKGSYGMSSGPTAQANLYTNYSGTSTTFGNIVALAAGQGNALYAAVARSLGASDSPATQATEGLFANPAALGATPSMIVSFSDYAIPASGGLPTYTGFATPVTPVTVNPGVNNFQAFVLGSGPDPRSPTSAVFGSKANTLQMAFQIDYTIYSGLTVDEARTVYAISGGTPAGVGRNPSPNLGEVMIFPDNSPADRRADYVDLRTDGTLPNPPSAGPNNGDGKSDRYDHIFVQAPLDPISFTPVGLSGLGRGFLLYLNRLAANPLANLPNGVTQGLSTSAGPIAFNDFDPSHEVAGGDLAFVSNSTTNYLDYEYLFGADIAGVCTTPWASFYLNSSGNVTFGMGDTTDPTVSSFLVGTPRIAAAWNVLDTSNRTTTNLLRFPVQALGFAGVNTFKVRWIDVPAEQAETNGTVNSNNFSIYLFDDGIGTYQTNPVALKGPTALRFIKQSDGTLVGFPPRPLGSAKFDLEYGRIDLPGKAVSPVLSGYSVGDQSPVASQTNLSTAGAKTAYCPQCKTLGKGTQLKIFEFFNDNFFDLRFEGSSALLTTPANQVDPNREFVDFAGKSCP